MRFRRPVLLLVNGLPGSGKSTLARRLADARPGLLVLDVDVVRALIGGAEADPLAAGPPARVLARAMAAAHLAAGHDVVVPQFLGRPEFADRLRETAAAAGAGSAEAVLEADTATVAARLRARSAAGAAPEHRAAARLLDAAGGEAELERMRKRLQALVAARPWTAAVPAEPAETALAALLRLLD